MKLKNVAKGTGLVALGFIFGKVWGVFDCMDNILENNPDVDSISYKAKTGTVTTKYNDSKNVDKKEEEEEA